MIRFANIEFLYALLLIPLFIIIFWIMLRWKKKAMSRFGDFQVIKSLMPAISNARTHFKFILLMIAYTFFIVGISNPQIGSKLKKVERKGIDLMIALDVSNSMLAEDIQPNRLERAKQSISKLIDNLQGDRIGIIVFAGKAYTQLPITTDYAAAKLFLTTIVILLVLVFTTIVFNAIVLLSISSLLPDFITSSSSVIAVSIAAFSSSVALSPASSSVLRVA